MKDVLRCGNSRLVLAALLSLWTAPVLSRGGTPAPLGPGFDSTAYAGQLRVTTFASGLSFPTSMQAYDGGVLVATTTGGNYFSPTSGGRLLLLTDTDNDGVADQTNDLTPLTGLPGGITSVRQAGNLFFVTTSAATAAPVINVLARGLTATSPLVSVGAINLSFSAPWEHTSYALATRATPSAPGNYDVLFNVGARVDQTSDAGNFATYHANATTTGNATGLSAAQLDPESIYKTTVSYNGTTAAFSAPVKVAGGLRNGAGIAFQPGTGNLYYDDNGMDGTAANGHPDDKYGNAAYSLDTLHKINQSDIGTTVPTSNFATDFYENTQPVTIHGNPDAVARFAPFGPFDPTDHNSSPNESEGPNEIAFAPAGFPAGLNNGVFIGFHGEFNSYGAPNTTTGAGNEEHAVVFYDLATGTYWHFIGDAEPDIGHLDGLLSTSSSLYLSDLADGDLFAPTPNNGPYTSGSIYQITAVPEPTTMLIGVMLGGLLVRRRR